MYKNYWLVAIRNMGRSKVFSAINILGLAIGMTCCFLILLFVRDEFSYDRFHQKADRIYRITYLPKFAGVTQALPVLSVAASPLLKNYFPEIESSARLFQRTATIQLGTAKFDEQRFFFADPALLNIFTFHFLQGNPATALTNTFSVVLSAKTAEKYFGNEPALGKTFRLDGQYPLVVSGVVEDFPDNSHIHPELMANYETMFATITEAARENLPSNWIISHSLTYVLLKPRQQPAPVDARFPAFLQKYAPPEFSGGIEYKLQPLTSIHLHSDLGLEIEPVGNILYVYLFLGIAFITLLIAGINFVNLSTARSLRRAKEVGMRKVLGAEKKQLVGQFLGESLLLSFGAFLLSIMLVIVLLPLFNDLTQKTFTIAGVFSDGLLLSSFIVIFLLAGLLAGLYPAFFLSGFDAVTTLKRDFTGGNNRGGILHRALLVFQFTASVALTIATLVVFRQLDFIRSTDLGFKKDHVLVVSVKSTDLNSIFDSPNDTLYQRLQSFRQAILRNPQVRAVTLSNVQPGQSGVSRDVIPEGFSQKDNLFAMDMKVDEHFIPAYGMQLAAGRNFSESFGMDRLSGMIINETAVKRYHWKSPAEAIGKTIVLTGAHHSIVKRATVIGVVKDFHTESLFQPIDVLLMDMDPGQLSTFSITISPDNTKATVAFLQSNFNHFFPDKNFNYDFLDRQLDGQYAKQQQLGKIIGDFSTLAVFISCLGLFGLIALAAQQRTREIGIRKVLGASVPGIIMLVSKDFLKLIVVAIAIAIPISWFVMHQWLNSFSYRTTLSWWIFFLAGAASIGIAFITVSLQAIKAALADPIKNLRSE
jgi:putative ABC transport system permease protein